ncbi:tyrosine-type recombinase/integrase [Streptomyces albus]|uniref:Site-specific integrase n=1 Tax=Streptomyces albus TaxID=1888 RepID=A0A8H1L631_9ACTN|nr:tyrosine-type recombinase/integrase [Streptomyces albus]TGG78420.1 site-specific integrase [Streptomyces albus]UVN59509.1 site-specific integrase [Streptomyces albus]
MTAAPRLRPAPEPAAVDDSTARLTAAVSVAFLTEVGWNPHAEVLAPPADHPLLSRGLCQVPKCGARANANGLCPSCRNRFRKCSLELEEFLKVPRGAYRKGQVVLCQVPGCPRTRKGLKTGLCSNHNIQYLRSYQHLTVAEFVVQPRVRPQRDLGECQVAVCTRRRDITSAAFCFAHGRQWALHRRRDPAIRREEWARLADPVAAGHEVVLRGLPPRVIVEILLGLQSRCQQGVSTTPSNLRSLVHCARQHAVDTLADLPERPARNAGYILDAALAAAACALSSPEEERRKDVWNLRVFGHRNELSFAGLRQLWLREAAKRWAADDLPRRRGRHVQGVLHSRISSLARLSDSLHLQRDDHGNDPTALGRRDIENFLNRLVFLRDSGEISSDQRLHICRTAGRILRDFRALGLTEPGEPAAGLPPAFTIRRGIDVPAGVVRTGQSRDLPPEVLRQLYDALPSLGGPGSHYPAAVEVLMDTGRRPNEIIRLGHDCLATDEDNKYVLRFTDAKNNREDQRLPITDTTAAVLRKQQRLVRSRYPDTPTSALKLFPARNRNPDGTRSATEAGLGTAHRKWVNQLPPLLLHDGSEFAKDAVTLYAYRHSYAQRHADAGTPPDVLRDLLAHEHIGTTQTYYRVTEKRIRTAIDKVVTYQFDRHGNRVWPAAKALLDHEHARMRVGSVAVPFGTCSEPSNVKAGGHACPFRFRCLGCGHFRTDPSYLPELRDYLHTLLRDRERLRAATELDAWAAAEATPSDDEINRLRALIRRTEQAVDDLTEEDRTTLDEAVRALRKVRQVVHLGMPGVAPPRTDPRLERDA